MAYIEKIAYHLGRKDEVPNQELARELAEKKDIEGIQEIAGYLGDKNKSIASDCLKVLYEIGYISPKLMSLYKDDYVALLNSKNNRMVWGAMIALSSVAKVEPDYVYRIKDLILEKIETGSVITNVWGVYTIINLADNGYYEELKEIMFALLRSVRPIDFAKRAESMMEVFKEKDLLEFKSILDDRLQDLTSGGQKRVNKLLNKLDK